MTNGYNWTWVQRHLMDKYSPSQNFFYSNLIEEIVIERRCSANICYEDVEYMCDDEQNLKRFYSNREFGHKMVAFKEYYFYHEDCPRIFMKSIQHAYAKWQDRKRDHAYKKLKLIYNESYSSLADPSNAPSADHTPFHISHFLLEISDYNPYSKKYYLRSQHQPKKRKDKINRTKLDLESLDHGLENMLKDINDISAISTLEDNNLENKRLFISKNNSLSQLKKPTDKNKSNQLSLNSSSSSFLKLNFKKNKQSVHPFLQNNLQKIIIKESKSKSKVKDVEKKSPKFASIASEIKLIKTRSIFSVSSYNPLQKKVEVKNSNSRPLKINHDIKRSSLNKNDEKNYGSQKKKSPKNIIIKSKSKAKIEIVKPLQKLRIREISVGKLQTKPDQFSDKKLIYALTDNRLRSHKSEFFSLPKRNNANTIRPNESTFQLTQQIRKQSKYYNYAMDDCLYMQLTHF